MNLTTLGCFPLMYKEGESDRLESLFINTPQAPQRNPSSTVLNFPDPLLSFLVLAPIQSAPLSVTNEQTTETERNASQIRERSDSESSTANNTELNRGVSRLPGGFLYLGYDHPRAPSPSV
ncbi:hypothetical protein BDW62DRAFT_201389 [Aspergillus aurantiobrunneus]